MANDENQREDRRQQTASHNKPIGHKKWRKRSAQSSQDQAIEFVDRLEHALRNLFK